MPTDTNEPTFYTSVFRHGVDEKRRVQIPARWRPESPDTEFTLFLWPNGNLAEACLMGLPPVEMRVLAEKLRGMSHSDPKASALRRLLGSKSASLGLDKAGRVCLPEWMTKSVGIGKEAVLVGLVDRFEIWNPERYEAASAVDQVMLPEAFKLI